MQREIIGLLDSGLGGISLLLKLYKSLSNTTFVYLGDGKNNPYGNKTNSELLGISFDNISLLKGYGAKKIFIACNTLSCMHLENLKSIFSEIDFFGVFPPIELCLQKKLNPLLLCTMATSRFFIDKNIDILAFKNLASDIENVNGLFGKVCLKNNLSQSVYYSKGKLKEDFSLKSDTLTTDYIKDYIIRQNLLNRVVILGCTHYYFIKNQIFNHFQPKSVIDSTTLTLDYYNSTYKKSKSLLNIYGNEVIFIGKNQDLYNKIFQDFIK